MNLCFVNSYYAPWVGGAESYVRDLSNALASRGHEVTVYCSDRPLHSGVSFDNKIRVVRMRTPLLLYGTPIVLFSPSIIAEEYDIIHANFPSPFLAIISSLAGKATNTPTVLTWHNDLPPVSSGASLIVKVHNSVSPSYLRNFSRIIATTSTYARKSEILRRFVSKVTVIRNGVDTKKFSPSVSGERIRSGYSLRGYQIVLFVGALTTFHSYKGVDILIKAFHDVSKRRTDSKLLIVGGGNMLHSYKQMAFELGLTDRIIFTGHVNDTILPEFYAACDIAVLPSKNSSEGFGLVLLEAMATGKAVIGSRTGGIVDVISDQKNGLLVEPDNPSELSSAIIFLLDNPDRRIAMGQAGKEFAILNDWNTVAEKVEAVYDQVRS